MKTSAEFYLSSAAFFLLEDINAVEECKVQRLFKIGELASSEWNGESFLKAKTTSDSWAYHSVWIVLSSGVEASFRKGEHS